MSAPVDFLVSVKTKLSNTFFEKKCQRENYSLKPSFNTPQVTNKLIRISISSSLTL